MIQKKDWVGIIIIGMAVGLLVQPILSNNAEQLGRLMPLQTLRVVIFFGFLVLAPLALFVASMVGKFVPVLYQFAKFAAVGTLNSLVDAGVFNIEYLLYGAKPSGSIFFAFKTISFFAGTTNSFFWNKFWTFEATEKVEARETFKFYLVAIIGGILNIGVATFVFKHPVGSVSPNTWGSVISPFSGILSAFIWDFLGYKFLVFKK